MFQKPYFLPSFIFLVLTAILHFLALEFHLYWDVWWFDCVVHFCGGICVALATLWFFYYSEIVEKQKLSNFSMFFRLIFTTFIIGIIWEFFEFHFGLTFIHHSNFLVGIFDSVSDIIMDLLGAIVVGFYISYLSDLDVK